MQVKKSKKNVDANIAISGEKAEMIVNEESKVGRPTKYKPEYCELLIKHMSAGNSLETFASIIDVDRDTLYEWKKVHPEFSDTVKRAFDKCQLFWETQGIQGLYNTTEYDEDGKPKKSIAINATVWIFNMKNRFKWRDKQPDENDNISININTNLADKMAKARKRVAKE